MSGEDEPLGTGWYWLRGWASSFLFLQLGHGTGSWALQTLDSTTWRSQMLNFLTTLLTSARPRRPPCAPGGPNSPCSVMTQCPPGPPDPCLSLLCLSNSLLNSPASPSIPGPIPALLSPWFSLYNSFLNGFQTPNADEECLGAKWQ